MCVWSKCFYFFRVVQRLFMLLPHFDFYGFGTTHQSTYKKGREKIWIRIGLCVCVLRRVARRNWWNLVKWTTKFLPRSLGCGTKNRPTEPNKLNKKKIRPAVRRAKHKIYMYVFINRNYTTLLIANGSWWMKKERMAKCSARLNRSLLSFWHILVKIGFFSHKFCGYIFNKRETYACFSVWTENV